MDILLSGSQAIGDLMIWGDKSSHLLLINCCQNLKEVNLASATGIILDYELEFLAKHISPNVEKLNLDNSNVGKPHIKILLERQNILSGESFLMGPR